MNTGSEPNATPWAVPGFFRGTSRIRNGLRLFWQLFRPPPGHKIRPTATGLVLIMLSLAIGVAAFNTAQNILYLGLSLLLGSLLLSGILSWLNFHGCAWRLLTDPHGRVGESLPVAVEIANRKRWLPSYGLTADVTFGSGEHQCRLVLDGRLAPRSERRLEWMIQPPHRGRHEARVSSLSSRFPFGFLDKSIAGVSVTEVLVWPPRVDYHLQLGRRAESHRPGDWRSRQGSGSEVINLRDYRAGDPIRMMHWKASARVGRLMTRETAEESASALALVIESDAARWSEEQVDRLAALVGTLAEDLFIQQRLGGVFINGDRGHALVRLPDLHALLDTLAVLAPVSGACPPAPAHPWIGLHFQPTLHGVEILVAGEVVGEG